MASLVRLAALRSLRKNIQNPMVVLGRTMGGGNVFEGGPPTTTLGGPFKVPV